MKFKLFLEIYNSQEGKKKIEFKEEYYKFLTFSLEKIQERFFLVKKSLQYYDELETKSRKNLYRFLKLLIIFKEGGN
jgi:hypothetical protein